MCLNMNISDFTNISEGLKVTLNLTQIIVKNIYYNRIFHACDGLSKIFAWKNVVKVVLFFETRCKCLN